MRYNCGAPSAPPTRICSSVGNDATACNPPRNAPGVIEVMLSTKRCVATSVNFALMSRPTETMWSPFIENAVSSTQSLCEPCCSTCLPLSASIARTVKSEQPNAICLPSGDQLAPYKVSYVIGTDTFNLRFSTSHTCTSPMRPGKPPATASFVPSGEKRTDSMRSEIPIKRASNPEPSA